MKNYYIIDYDKGFVNSKIDLVGLHNSEWELKRIHINRAITDEAYIFLTATLKITPFESNNLFIGIPNGITHIHTDVNTPGDPVYAFNYAWGGTNAKMCWYRPLITSAHKLQTTAKTKYSVYHDNEVECIEELNFPNNTLVLVRVDIPHRVINYSPSKRYCLSIRGQPLMSWNNIVDYVKNYIRPN